MGKGKNTAKRSSTLCTKNPVAHRLAEQISGHAVVSALEDKIGKTGRLINRNRARLEAIQAEAAALPVLDSRSMDEIPGYDDEFAMPR